MRTAGVSWAVRVRRPCRRAGRVVEAAAVEGDGQGVVLGCGAGGDLDEQAVAGRVLPHGHRGVLGVDVSDRPADVRLGDAGVDVAGANHGPAGAGQDLGDVGAARWRRGRWW